MARMKYPVLVFLLLVAAFQAEAKSAFSGTYAINGMNPGVGAYSGTVVITARGDVYDVAWTIANAHYTGVGIASGDTLSIAYSAADHSWLGVMSYSKRPNGSLEGRWAVQGRQGAPGTETAVRK